MRRDLQDEFRFSQIKFIWMQGEFNSGNRAAPETN